MYTFPGHHSTRHTNFLISLPTSRLVLCTVHPSGFPVSFRGSHHFPLSQFIPFPETPPLHPLTTTPPPPDTGSAISWERGEAEVSGLHTRFLSYLTHFRFEFGQFLLPAFSKTSVPVTLLSGPRLRWSTVDDYEGLGGDTGDTDAGGTGS